MPPGSFGGLANPPTVTNISGLGVFSGASTTFTPDSLTFLPGAQVAFTLPNSTTLMDGAPVAEVFFDTTQFSDGDIFEYGLDNGSLPGTTFSIAGAQIETLSPLTFFATVEAVPEPSSSAFLFALGSVAMLRRKRG